MLFFDAFSYSFPAFLQRIPFSLTEAVVWSALSYFPVGLAGEPGRSAAPLPMIQTNGFLHPCATKLSEDGHQDLMAAAVLTGPESVAHTTIVMVL